MPRLDEQEHREEKQRHVGEVAALLVLAVHVADRVGDDQRADPGDDQHHHHAQLVGQEREAEVVAARPRARSTRSSRGRGAAADSPSMTTKATTAAANATIVVAVER